MAPDATALGDAFAAGELEPVGVMESLLRRIEDLDPTVGACNHVAPVATLLTDADAAAQRWRAGVPRSPLDGVPFGVKANIAVAVWPWHAVLAARLALALSGRRGSTRLVWGVRCSDMDMRRYARSARYVVKPLAFLSSKTELVTYNSQAGRVAHERMGYRPPKYRVVPNGFDVDHFRPRPEERSAVRAEMGLGDEHFVVGMCARVDPMKDHESFVKAAVVFAATAPEARFVLVGAGTDRPGSRLERMVVASGLAERFVRLGQRRDIGRIHAALDLATLSSAFGEGFSNALAEAMACGVPCVATDVGDSASIIGDTGLVVPPRDAEALAAAWDRLRREGRIRRAELGTAARRRVASRYGLAAMIKTHRALYGELVRSGSARDS